ncbi:M24 family metallopeptidase [Treponema brennaborense]|uniref:Peptidase M24 n=1 Tax=Treponema brennaborense (strain DSM 12168 / CIP 105900 / DD5/3) TaxID=906968 RepID=F4LJD3_TREBD|nr:Xaa-Pro peptidase family protein [Treponema brennaborense]AEE17378.1 peptidase M24 [Treponema brennaborense DSM 12168]
MSVRQTEKPYSQFCLRRKQAFAQKLQEANVAAAFFEDTEGRRDPAIRYFTGHPGDALLVVTAKGESVLCPWDEHMAALMAEADTVLPFTKFARNPLKAAAGIFRKLKLADGSRIEIPPETPYPLFLRFVDALAGYNVLCRENGSHEEAVLMRAVKDEYEIGCIRKAAAVTDAIIELIEARIKDGTIQTETDAALLIERECRNAGCEGTGFETLAAGPARSFGIHCFPPYTAQPFPADGLSILDFGVVTDGYTSDVTLTVAKGTLTPAQEAQLELTEKAYAKALELYNPGVPIKAAALKADEVFAKAKKSMPHALGHGIGLEAHEFPPVKPAIPPETVFVPGMVVTLEPGLYDPANGGCRLENDVLITETGHEVLTKSKIIRL